MAVLGAETLESAQLAAMVPTPAPTAAPLLAPPTPGVPPPTPGLPPTTPGLVPPATPMPPTPLPMDVEMPHLPPDQVHSLLEQHEQSLVPPVTPAVQPLSQQPVTAVIEQAPPQTQVSIQQLPEEQLPHMENMGYDVNNPLMANMGYDDQHPPAQTPGAISERGVATPWNEDYEFPASVGLPEEQQVDETYEQFEERVLNKRAGHMYHIVKSKLMRSDKLYLSEMVHRNNRKQVAQKFYTLLVLKKHVVLELYQEGSYDDIMITRGAKFDNPSL